MAAKMAMVRYRPRKVSAMNPPRRQNMKEVPKKLVTAFAASALPRCIVPVKYVTRFTAIPSVASLSTSSTTFVVCSNISNFKSHVKQKTNSNDLLFFDLFIYKNKVMSIMT